MGNVPYLLRPSGPGWPVRPRRGDGGRRRGDDASLPIGDEGVVTPRGEQLGLLADEPGATNHETVPVAIGTLGDLRLSAERVVDGGPILFGDGLDGPDHGLVQGGSDGVADVVVTTGFDHMLGVEPRVRPQGQLASRSGPPRSADRLSHEPRCAPATAGRTFPVADVQDLPGVRPDGDERMLAEHPGVAIGSTLFLLPIDLLDRRVDVDGHWRVLRTGPERPCPRQHLLTQGIELADVSEGERPEEGAK